MKKLLVLIILFIFNSCEKVFDDSNPIFPETKLIRVSLPAYTTTSDYPDFVWSSPSDCKYQVVGIFTNKIIINGKNIVNKNDCIAMWHTGLTGQAGNVNYTFFKVTINGEIKDYQPSALQNGNTYYWAVWGYDKDLKLTHSSDQIQFTKN
ncbi:MAG: hypothetical protein ACP5Q5_08165 [Brevinematia bacterium]